MSETEIKKEEVVSEANGVVNKDAVDSNLLTLKMTQKIWVRQLLKFSLILTLEQRKKVKKVSDQVNKDANDGSLPKDNAPSGMKEEEAEVEGEEEIAEDKVESTEMNIDLSDDVKALVSTDADLSEEFKG